jgi:class 3 adenylate cyclase
MGLRELRSELVDEVSSILANDFTIEVTNTNYVPGSDDPAITFPNLDTKTQGTKLIETCVLYIDIRRSTDLNLSHKPRTVAKLYSAFVRAMTRTARHHDGHVRGIIGDRVMVIFDKEDAFINAVNCAIAMNTISQHVINTHFKANEVKCGIGIDSGKMLATKTGIRRHGDEQANYKSLVWLGRPANIASKLTDIANKSSEHGTRWTVNVAYDPPPLPWAGLLSESFGIPPAQSQSPWTGLFAGSPGVPSPQPQSPWTGLFSGRDVPPVPTTSPLSTSQNNWQWKEVSLKEFVSQLEVKYAPTRIVHKDAQFGSFFLSDQFVQTRDATPPILMTKSVWDGFRRGKQEDPAVRENMFKKVKVSGLLGYDGEVYGGDVIFPALKG